MDFSTILVALGLCLIAVLFMLLHWPREGRKPVATNKLGKIIDRPSPNQDDRDGDVSILIQHFTAMDTTEAAIQRLCDPAAKVSAHYVVGEDGQIYRLVPENKVAWHAGVSFWRGRRNLNGVTIGIEIANKGDEVEGYAPYPQVQMDAVAELTRDILSRHNIPAQNVIGHSDIAPGRKPDPGPRFDWQWLFASHGIGIWPTPEKQDYDTSKNWSDTDVRRALTKYGYSTDVDLKTALDAFQRHFHQEVFFKPNDGIGKADAETCARLAWLVRHKSNSADDVE
jgi:N-acetylmuramoyl-L-alanine amidase